MKLRSVKPAGNGCPALIGSKLPVVQREEDLGARVSPEILELVRRFSGWNQELHLITAGRRIPEKILIRGPAWLKAINCGRLDSMAEPLTAHDLLPLVEKLPHDEQVRLAKLALRAAAGSHDDRRAYAKEPPTFDEFGTDGDPLAWEGDGWEHFGAPR